MVGLGMQEILLLGICLVVPLSICAVILCRWLFVLSRTTKEQQEDERVEREDIDDENERGRGKPGRPRRG